MSEAEALGLGSVLWETSHLLAKSSPAHLWPGPFTQCHLKAIGQTLGAGTGVPTFKKK